MARTWIAYAIIASLCTSLMACDQSEKMRRTIDQRATEAQQALASAAKTVNPVPYDPLTVTNKIWNGSTAHRMQRGMPLPSKYEDSRGVTLVSSEPMSITELSNAVSAQTGIPIRLFALALTSGKPTSPIASRGQTSSNDLEMPVSYEGPLSGLLDRMSAFFGTSWRYDGATISISRYETRVFVVEALPGTQEINEGMQDDQSASSGGSTSSSSSSGSATATTTQVNTLTQNSKTTVTLKYWDELKEVINSIVGQQGGAVISPTMGTVTVTTTPDVMATVAEYLAKENKRLSRQIAINVQIYSVTLNQSEDFGVAFTGFLKNLSSFSGFSYDSAGVPGFTNSGLSRTSLGTLGVAIINGPNDPTMHAGDVLTALSAIGDASEVAQFPMTTLNNHPVSRRVGKDRSYIATINSSTTTSSGTGSVLWTPVIQTIHDGFSLQLTPRLLDDGRMLLQYSLSLIGLESRNTTSFDTGDLVIPLDLPITDNRIFVQQSMLRSGQTLIIGGVDQETITQNKQGVGDPDNFLLGGGTSSNNNRLMLFMAITPQVMDVGATEERT